MEVGSRLHELQLWPAGKIGGRVRQETRAPRPVVPAFRIKICLLSFAIALIEIITNLAMLKRNNILFLSDTVCTNNYLGNVRFDVEVSYNKRYISSDNRRD